jgi:hypothetical protein
MKQCYIPQILSFSFCLNACLQQSKQAGFVVLVVCNAHPKHRARPKNQKTCANMHTFFAIMHTAAANMAAIFVAFG